MKTWLSRLRERSLSSRIWEALLVCGLLPVLIISVASRTILRTSLLESELAKYSVLSGELARQVENTMRGAAVNLYLLSESPIVVDSGWSDAERHREMERIVASSGVFKEIGLYSASGLLIDTTAPDFREAEDKTVWLRRALRGEPCLSPPQKSLSRPDLHIRVYLPVKSQGGGQPRVVRGLLAFEPVWQLLDGVEVAGQSGEVALLDEVGNFLSSRNKEKILKRFDPRFTQAWWRERPTGVYESVDGRRYYYVANHLDPAKTHIGRPWTLLTLVPERAMLAFINDTTAVQVLAGLVTTGLALVVGLVFSGRLSRPLVEAASAAKEVTSGNLDVRIKPATAARETTQFAADFNAMVGEMQRHRTELESLVAERTQSLIDSRSRLEELSAHLHAAFEASQEGILIVTTQGRLVVANRRFADLFHLNAAQLRELQEHPFESGWWRQFTEPEEFAEAWHQVMGQLDGILEKQWETRGARRRVLASYATPVRHSGGGVFAVLWVFNDLTKQRELQESLEQAQKMEAIGRLAGGVAHDFNNLLTGITGNLTLAEMQLRAPARARSLDQPREHLRHARATAERAAQLVKELLGFSRRSHLSLVQCDLNEALEEFFPLIRKIIEPRVELRLELGADLWPVRADTTKFEQIVMNLCTNARDAIADRGEIVIRTSNERMTAALATRHHTKPGDYVCISVSDTGSGIPPEVSDKIFEPFFTTKEPGKGTGLGLATSYGIVQQHGGSISCESPRQGGSVFRVYFPRDRSKKAPVPERAPEKVIAGGDETVLLVDDELVVRMVAETLLRGEGYKIICASDGAEAVEVFRRHRHEIGLIFMDMSMPRMSGREAFGHIRAIDPEVPVIICSGYVVDLADVAAESGSQPDGFVQKPYDFKDMLGTARAILDARRARRAGAATPGESSLPALAG